MTLIMVGTSALNVKVMRTQARVNGESNHVSTSVDVAVWLESTMNRVSDGDRSTSLSFLSCGALQSGEIIGILKQLKAVQKEEEDGQPCGNRCSEEGGHCHFDSNDRDKTGTAGWPRSRGGEPQERRGRPGVGRQARRKL